MEQLVLHLRWLSCSCHGPYRWTPRYFTEVEDLCFHQIHETYKRFTNEPRMDATSGSPGPASHHQYNESVTSYGSRRWSYSYELDCGIRLESGYIPEVEW